MAVLFIALWLHSPQQIPVVVYKLLLAPLGGLAGCCVWLALVPYANPSRYLVKDWRSDPDADIDGKADFEVAPGYDAIFCMCLFCAALAFVVGMLAVGWACDAPPGADHSRRARGPAARRHLGDVLPTHPAPGQPVPLAPDA